MSDVKTMSQTTDVQNSIFTSRNKHQYSSSSWYYIPDQTQLLFPTIQEQVTLCRQLASQLVDDKNAKSRGAQMFLRRVRRAHSWEHCSPDEAKENMASNSESPDLDDEALRAMIKQQRATNNQLPPEKVIWSPKGRIVSLESLQQPELYCTHSAAQAQATQSRLANDLIQLLNDVDSENPGMSKRAARLFLARKLKAKEWEEAAEQRREQITQRLQGIKPLPAIMERPMESSPYATMMRKPSLPKLVPQPTPQPFQPLFQSQPAPLPITQPVFSPPQPQSQPQPQPEPQPVVQPQPETTVNQTEPPPTAQQPSAEPAPEPVSVEQSATKENESIMDCLEEQTARFSTVFNESHGPAAKHEARIFQVTVNVSDDFDIAAQNFEKELKLHQQSYINNESSNKPVMNGHSTLLNGSSSWKINYNDMMRKKYNSTPVSWSAFKEHMAAIGHL